MENKKILVALSGGIDSSVAALLLKKEGWEVEGVHFLFFQNSPKNLTRVKRVAQKLEIKLHVINEKKLFKEKVENYLIGEYKKGRTPNPCVICNKKVKFLKLAKVAEENGFSQIATGHYARRFFLEIKTGDKNSFADWFIKKGRDSKKDQSYFLSALGGSLIKKCVFPLGDYCKEEVLTIGKKAGLFNFSEKESQGICFLKNPFREFIRKKIKNIPGRIIDQNKNLIGKHQGLSLYTLGQREAIGIGGSGPYFVTGKNYFKNELRVSNIGDDPKLFFKEIKIKLSPLGASNYKRGKKIIEFFGQRVITNLSVKVRYGETENKITCFEKLSENCFKIMIKGTVRALAKGQIAVIYNKEKLLFGGIII